MQPYREFSILNIQRILIHAVNCQDPMPPSDGDVGVYPHTREGATVAFWCNDGFRPSANMTSTCTITSDWIPPPDELICTFVEGI